MAVLPAAREARRSNDTDYRYRQDSDFYYVTGFSEPEAVAVIAPAHPEHKYTLFVRPRDPEREVWDGRRAGVEGARETYGADAAFPVAEFGEKLGDLLNGARSLYYRLGNGSPELDDQIVRQIARMRAQGRRGVHPPSAIIDPGAVLHEMRLVKSVEEVALMRRAAEISAEAHREAMRRARPGMKEYEVEALIEYVFRRSGAAGPAYTTIVGAGERDHPALIQNDAELDTELCSSTPAPVCNYPPTSRALPRLGALTEAQRELYSLCCPQQECIEMVRPRRDARTMHHVRSSHHRAHGPLGPSRRPREAHRGGGLRVTSLTRPLPRHGLPTWAATTRGEESRPVEPGIVMTVEPGIYVAADAEGVPDQYRGIGVRIEDDVLVTSGGHEILTAAAPKQVEEIESLMASAR